MGEGRGNPTRGHASALSSVLSSVLTVDVDVDRKTETEAKCAPEETIAEAKRLAAEIRLLLFPHRAAPLPDEDRLFLGCAAVLALTRLSREWLDGAVRATLKAPRRNPLGYLRRTLQQRLIEYEGRCSDIAEAQAVLGRLMREVRPIVHAQLRRAAEAAKEE